MVWSNSVSILRSLAGYNPVVERGIVFGNEGFGSWQNLATAVPDRSPDAASSGRVLWELSV
jgi:hypothetical protein